MRTLIALSHIVYGGKSIEAGEEFTAQDGEAEGFILTGKAVKSGSDAPPVRRTPAPIPDPPAVSRQPYKVPEEAESKPVEPMTTDNVAPVTGPRRYMRRDMKPKE